MCGKGPCGCVARERPERDTGQEVPEPAGAAPTQEGPPLYRALALGSAPVVSHPADQDEQMAERLAQSLGDGVPGAGRAVRPESPGEHASGPPGGRALGAGLRGWFEQRLGGPLGAVRIHTDQHAADAARQLQARAFTLGTHIGFGAGEYAPQTARGHRLLAHELAHVVASRGHGAAPLKVHRQPTSAPAPTATAAPPAAPAPAAATPATATAGGTSAPSRLPMPDWFYDRDKGPFRPKSKSFYFQGVEMTTDPDYQHRELKLLVSRFGIKGLEMWYGVLKGTRGTYDLPFSAHARAFGGLRVRGPLDAQRDIQNEQARSEIGTQAVAVVDSLYPGVHAEAVAFRDLFEKRMHGVLLGLLAESEQRIDTERVRYGLRQVSPGPGGTVEASDTVAFRGVVGAAKDLLEIRKPIEAIRNKQMLVMLASGAAGATQYATLERQAEELEQGYDTARMSVALRYPALGALLDDAGRGAASFVLARVATGELRSPRAGSQAWASGTAGLLQLILDRRLRSINEVRDKVNGDTGLLWSLPQIVALTQAALITSGNIMADKIIEEKIKDIQFDKEILSAFLMLAAVALMIPTGGGSLGAVAAVGRAALSGYQAAQSLQRYQFESALASTDLNKRAYAIAAEDPSLAWLALDVTFAVVDGAAALKAMRELSPLAREALLATEEAEAARSAAKLAAKADALGKPGLGGRLLEKLAALRRRPATTRLLGEAGQAEVRAVAQATEAIGKEASGATHLASVAGHDVRLTKSGLLVICTECTWLRERFARELADNPGLLTRMSEAEGKAAHGSLDAAGRAEVQALTRDLQTAREARLTAEIGPLAAKVAAIGDARAGFASVLARRPGISQELADLEKALASATKIDPSMVARMDSLQARLAQLHEIDAISAAPRNARIVEVSADKAAANFYKTTADVVPGPPVVLEFPDGSRIWRDSVGGPIRQEATLGESAGRAGMERDMYSAGAHGNLPAGPKYQRAHTLGQGTGFESPYGVLYAPEAVNQTLQNHGIEAYMRSLAASAQPGETFRVLTKTVPHTGQMVTQRLATIEYSIVRVTGGQAEEVASYAIHVTSSAEHPVVTAAAMRFTPTAAGRAVAARVAPPDVLTKAFSFSY